jgi:hypothetical protein
MAPRLSINNPGTSTDGAPVFGIAGATVVAVVGAFGAAFGGTVEVDGVGADELDVVGTVVGVATVVEGRVVVGTVVEDRVVVGAATVVEGRVVVGSGWLTVSLVFSSFVRTTAAVIPAASSKRMATNRLARTARVMARGDRVGVWSRHCTACARRNHSSSNAPRAQPKSWARASIVNAGRSVPRRSCLRAATVLCD